MAVPVNLNRWPLSAHLQAWGRADTGWWGCITWRQPVRVGEQDGEIAVAAWVPAAIIRPSRYSGDTKDLPRVELGDDPAAWPLPNGSPAWQVGRWLDGDLPLPPGVVADNISAWERKRRR